MCVKCRPRLACAVCLNVHMTRYLYLWSCLVEDRWLLIIIDIFDVKWWLGLKLYELHNYTQFNMIYMCYHNNHNCYSWPSLEQNKVVFYTYGLQPWEWYGPFSNIICTGLQLKWCPHLTHKHFWSFQILVLEYIPHPS